MGVGLPGYRVCPRDWAALEAAKSRLKGGCGQDWPPHKIDIEYMIGNDLKSDSNRE